MTKTLRAVAVIAVLAAAITACSGDPSALAADIAEATAAGGGVVSAAEIDGSADLSAAEIDGLLWMREEEKLARDVYLALFDRWGAQIFDTIASSEQRHTDAVATLIDGFGLDDPVVDDTPGAFTNGELADLYDDLVEQGSASLVDALAVGALVEELDIWDLRRWLEDTDDADIERIYENLLGGSENHLRAFVARLEANGAPSSPSTWIPTTSMPSSVTRPAEEEPAAAAGGDVPDRPAGRPRGMVSPAGAPRDP